MSIFRDYSRRQAAHRARSGAKEKADEKRKEKELAYKNRALATAALEVLPEQQYLKQDRTAIFLLYEKIARSITFYNQLYRDPIEIMFTLTIMLISLGAILMLQLKSNLRLLDVSLLSLIVAAFLLIVYVLLRPYFGKKSIELKAESLVIQHIQTYALVRNDYTMMFKDTPIHEFLDTILYTGEDDGLYEASGFAITLAEDIAAEKEVDPGDYAFVRDIIRKSEAANHANKVV